MSRIRLEYKSEPQSGCTFLKAEGAIEVLYPSELEEIKEKLMNLGIKLSDMKVYVIEQMPYV